ncbi:hypothetical protein [Blastococcus sp. SYSU DS0539]
MSTVAATIGPMPLNASRSGRQERTMVRIVASCAAASASRNWMRRARSRITVRAVTCSMLPLVVVGRSRTAVVIMTRVD